MHAPANPQKKLSHQQYASLVIAMTADKEDLIENPVTHPEAALRYGALLGFNISESTAGSAMEMLSIPSKRQAAIAKNGAASEEVNVAAVIQRLHDRQVALERRVSALEKDLGIKS